MSEYQKAKKRIDVSIGESVRIIRELQELSTRTRKYDHVCGSAIWGRVVQGAPATDSPGGLSSSAQRGNTPNAAPSLWDLAFLALGSVGRGAQGLLAWHDSTASPSIQNRLGIRDRIYEFEYLVRMSCRK